MPPAHFHTPWMTVSIDGISTPGTLIHLRRNPLTDDVVVLINVSASMWSSKQELLPSTVAGWEPCASI